MTFSTTGSAISSMQKSINTLIFTLLLFRTLDLASWIAIMDECQHVLSSSQVKIKEDKVSPLYLLSQYIDNLKTEPLPLNDYWRESRALFKSAFEFSLKSYTQLPLHELMYYDLVQPVKMVTKKDVFE
jgi:hypothetical protein